MDNITLFEGYSMEDLYKQVVSNTRQNRNSLKATIDKLAQYIKNILDVQMISPQISSYMNILVKNDQMLVKLATVAAKLNAISTKYYRNQDDNDLTEEDKRIAMDLASKQMVSILDELRSQHKATK